IHGRLLPQIVIPVHTFPPKRPRYTRFTGYRSYITLGMLAICRESTREQDEKRCSSEHARPDGVCRLGRSKKVVIVDAPKGTTSSSTEENFGFWIDEATKIITLADGKEAQCPPL